MQTSKLTLGVDVFRHRDLRNMHLPKLTSTRPWKRRLLT